MCSVLLIDDKADHLDDLTADLQKANSSIRVETWVPISDDNPLEKFEDLLEEVDPDLVVTDHDLTTGGQTGLFGATIVDWCQQRALPVGDYSRKPKALPQQPDLFELRIRTDAYAGEQIAALAEGFRVITTAIQEESEPAVLRSPAAVLAHILDRPETESQFALYSVRVGPTSGALMERITADLAREPAAKGRLLAYIPGHLLVNSILKFPGPILSLDALKAYVATNEAEADDIQQLLSGARYDGPFSQLDRYYWTAEVDQIIDKKSKEEGDTETAASEAEWSRAVLERAIGRRLKRHDCPRCDGEKGGYYCPFTKRTVCELPECSVTTSSWIPQGASVVKIEREFFEEWEPILGL